MFLVLYLLQSYKAVLWNICYSSFQSNSKFKGKAINDDGKPTILHDTLCLPAASILIWSAPYQFSSVKTMGMATFCFGAVEYQNFKSTLLFSTLRTAMRIADEEEAFIA